MVSSPRIRVALGSAGMLILFAVAASAAVTVVVTSAADAVTSCATTGLSSPLDGGCTLRDAITYSNANPPTSPAQNLIQFNIPGGGVQTITLTSDLPSITTATIVDGYSQPGASPNTLAIGSDAVLLILVDGSVLEDGATILQVSGGQGSVIQGLIVQGVDIDGSGGAPQRGDDAIGLASCCNRVAGNFIGIDPTGTYATQVRTGIRIDASSSFNQIGGLDPASRNVICNTGAEDDNGFPFAYRIIVGGDENVVEGNYIGANAAGNGRCQGVVAGSDRENLRIDGSLNVVNGNVITDSLGGVRTSGNEVEIGGSQNVLTANLIGTDATGTVSLSSCCSAPAVGIYGSQNVIGSSGSQNPILQFLFKGNTVAFSNFGEQFEVAAIQVFGSGIRNSILSNSLFSNSFGIDLNHLGNTGIDGMTPNDPGDADDGGNHLQNYPVLTGASDGSLKTAVQGTLNSAANTTYRVQLFSNSACDPSGFGQGETLVDEVFVATNGNGNASFKDSIFPRVPPGQYITSTATDPLGNTSEFSKCIQVQPVGPPPPPPWHTITRFLEEGPIRVAPGVPVELPFGVEARPEGTRSAAGRVVLSDDGVHRCEATLIRSGVGACALTFASEGSYRVVARYAAAGDFLASQSDGLIIIVAREGD